MTINDHFVATSTARKQRAIKLFRMLENTGAWGDKERELIRLILSELWSDEIAPVSQVETDE